MIIRPLLDLRDFGAQPGRRLGAAGWHLRWHGVPLGDVLQGYSLHYLEKTRQTEWLREQSSY